jgi:hypothetical protein
VCAKNFLNSKVITNFMKAKTFCRLFGLYEAGVSAFLGNLGYQAVSNTPIRQIFESDAPLAYKVALGAWGTALGIATAGIGLTFVDGAVDVVRGTHHYTIGSVYKMLSRNEKTKKELSDYLEKSLAVRDLEFKQRLMAEDRHTPK